MELKDVFASTAVILVAVVAAGTWIGFLNASYNTSAGSSFNSTIASVTSTLGTNLNSTAIAAGENTFAQQGAGGATQQQGLIARSLSSIQQVGAFFSIIPNLLGDAAEIMGLPAPYAQIAGWVFAFALGITIALIFLQVVGRFF